jgi:Peptidase inhibitor I78 family
MTRPQPVLLGLGLALALGACAELKQAGGGSDACGAGAHQDWVGQRVDALNDVALPEGARVLFPTTPAGDETDPARLNVTVDKSDTIARVYCG